jgi:hypothetical protein
MYNLGVDAYNTSKYERIATQIAASHAGITVLRLNPMPNWRKHEPRLECMQCSKCQ